MLTAGMVERRPNDDAAIVAALIESKGNSRICSKSFGLLLALGSQRARTNARRFEAACGLGPFAVGNVGAPHHAWQLSGIAPPTKDRAP
jgi:hypothetical protein